MPNTSWLSINAKIEEKIYKVPVKSCQAAGFLKGIMGNLVTRPVGEIAKLMAMGAKGKLKVFLKTNYSPYLKNTR